MPDEIRFDGRVAVIAGAGSLGRSHALAEEGRERARSCPRAWARRRRT
jgi:hypothetical protein